MKTRCKHSRDPTSRSASGASATRHKTRSLPRFPVDVKKERLPSCGKRTAELIERLKSFDVVFTRSESASKVIVNDEEWQFDGFTEPHRDHAVAKAVRSGVSLQLWFGATGAEAHGHLVVIVYDGDKAICGDTRKLIGKYTPP